ncbi:MAG: glucose-1-phosphate cytidylyltransferase [Candidatus Baltobacteraceae bacterium]
MKVVLLAGGLGTRLAEETEIKPKPMVEIGGFPILWHIMSIYAAAGFNEFVIALGYKGNIIKDYFLNFHAHNSDFTLDLNSNSVTYGSRRAPNWTVHLMDTGEHTMTGGRLLALQDVLRGERFMLTYGDGVARIDVADLLRFHEEHGKIATLTAVRPPARFGSLVLDGSHGVTDFVEKPQVGEGWINGGFFVFEPEIFKYLDDEQTILERSPLEKLSNDSELRAYKLDGFWQPMDTLREKRLLEDLWSDGKAPWKVWEG